jgi:FtsP/CotA-like multicopper oxidase with cupredoxin domain
MSSLRPDLVVNLNGADSITEEWVVQNYTLENHAFHIHQIHFRDISAGGRDPQNSPLLDTVNAPPAANVNGVPGTPGQRTLLTTFGRAQIGEFVFHCHVLGHEDAGIDAEDPRGRGLERLQRQDRIGGRIVGTIQS